MFFNILQQDVCADFYVFCELCVVSRGSSPETTKEICPAAYFFCDVFGYPEAFG